MPVIVTGFNETNSLKVFDGLLENYDGQIRFEGNFNSIEIEPLSSANRISISVGDHCAIHIGEECKLGCIDIYAQKGSKIHIGSRSSFTWQTSIMAHESFDVTIGDNCLFASETLITVSDMHPIFDRASGKRLNLGKSVSIGNNVWLGLGATLMKGAAVGDGAVIAARSVVTGIVPEYCVAAGVPARVTRRNVEWRHDLNQSHITPTLLPGCGETKGGLFSKLKSALLGSATTSKAS
ncbi:acyltransferase [Agrobacterium tumefaciens]|uniref:acyltransferase n=1 Tax=Agrobacterium tumefaciens TaxID=358 RepID=UPI001B8A895B|nr:acyltransferase [Agrobacterium tumefaciens]WCK64491.1 acyltransferase [Agrobacterium tumefaciens]